MFQPSEHAVRRYISRFEGNLSFNAAAVRLRRIARSARFRRALPGHARLYSVGPINLVVHEGVVLTVYRLTSGRESLIPWRA